MKLGPGLQLESHFFFFFFSESQEEADDPAAHLALNSGSGQHSGKSNLLSLVQVLLLTPLCLAGLFVLTSKLKRCFPDLI